MNLSLLEKGEIGEHYHDPPNGDGRDVALRDKDDIDVEMNLEGLPPRDSRAVVVLGFSEFSSAILVALSK